MVKYKTIMQTVDVVDDIICNKCEKSLRSDMCGGNFHGLEDIWISGGFDSPVFADCDEYKFSLCEHCLKEIFDTFKIPAFVHNTILD